MEDNTRKILKLFVVFMVIAFVLRVIMGYYIEGQAGDLGCFKGWGPHGPTIMTITVHIQVRQNTGAITRLYIS